MAGQRTAFEPHQIRLIEGGEAYFALLRAALTQARSEVLLETYIFDFRGSSQAVAEALEQAALRGVQVRLVVDGVGTGALPREWAQRLTLAGVQWRVYSPLGALGLLVPSRWRRLHRKLCVVDGRVGFCGGINLVDDWIDPYHGPLPAPRLDFAVQVQGALVSHMQDTMTRLWWRMQAVRDVQARHFPEAYSAWRTAGRVRPWEVEGQDLRVHRAALLLRDNLLYRRQIERAYLRAIGAARQSIVIANAYFFPGRRLRRALVLAAQRGVRVRLLLQGRYEFFWQQHALRPVYAQLLAAGVEIHEYTASFLHAKVAVVDAPHERPWATVGSSNLDPLSLLLAREANVAVADATFARQLHDRLDAIMSTQSRRVLSVNADHRPHWQRLRDGLTWGLMRLALFLIGRRY